MASILVADDDAQQLVLRQALLEMAGHEVRVAFTARDAARQIESALPDLLLMDLRFPNAEGEQDAAEGLGLIRAANRQSAALPVIVLSGWPEQLAGRPEAAMVKRVVAKPCRIEALLEAIRAALALLACLIAAAGAARAQPFRFHVGRPAEVIAELEMSSPGSDWSAAGREAALATLRVDGSREQHVMLFAGESRHTYAAFLGTLAAGEHVLTVERHAKFSAAASGLRVHNARFRDVPRDDPYWPVLAHAPILYARADTVGKFTDVPLFAYCEKLVEDGKPLLQYTTVFSNEDGGTSTRALMARWGRTTDIEYIYRGWLDAAGSLERATIQAKNHEEIPFDGRLEGTHPVLIPSTLNNMVSAQGESEIRYQVPPAAVDLGGHSREETMDERPWSYRVMAQELAREGKLRPFGEVRGQSIGDPRRYLHLEVKVANRTSALGVWVQLRNDATWRSSHLGRPDYGIERDGWVRTTVELPPGTRPADIAAVGFECLVKPAQPANVAGECAVEAVSKSFFLTQDWRPGVTLFSLREAARIPSGQMRVFPVVLSHVASTSASGPDRSPRAASR